MIRSWPHFLALLLLLPLAVVQAERKPVALGLLGGVGAASLWGDDVEELDIRIWPVVGVSLAFHLPVFLGFETDLIYSSKGSGFSGKDTTDRVKVTTVTAHCLDIPFLLKMTAPTGSEVTPIVFGGPTFSYFVSKKVATEYMDIGQGGMVSVENIPPLVDRKDLPDYEWNLTVGGGVEWGLGTFQLRFTQAYNSLDQSKVKDIRTFLISVMAGFIF